MKKLLTSLFLIVSLAFVGLITTNPVHALEDLSLENTFVLDKWLGVPNRRVTFTNGDFASLRNLIQQSNIYFDESSESVVSDSTILTLDKYDFVPADTSENVLYLSSWGTSFSTSSDAIYISLSDINYNYYELKITEDSWEQINSGQGDYEQIYPNAAFTFNFSLPDNIRPAISGQENFVTSVDDPKSVSYFQSFLSAYDETDGDLTSSIYIVNDNYTPNKAVLGTWEVTFGVKDAADNESTLLVYVTVADVTKPVITGNATKVQISYTKTWDIAAFKSTLSITDNYDTLDNSDIVVHSDTYTSNKTNLGTHTIVFRGTDDSGNYVDFTKQVEVIDDVPPIINGPTTLTKPTTSIVTLAEIKAQLSATDAKEGNLTSSITVVEDNYTGNGHRVGNYTITFRVADSKGNATTHVVTMTVVDNIPPIWYIQDGVSIKIVPPATITRQQIVDILVATGQLNITSTMQVNFTHDNYTGNEMTPGVYMMTLAYQDTSGNEGVHTLSVTVLEDENEDPITVTPKPSFFDSIGAWIAQNVLVTTIFAGLLLIGVLFLVFKPKKKKYRRR